MLSNALGLEYDYLECEAVGSDLRVDPRTVSDRAVELL